MNVSWYKKHQQKFLNIILFGLLFVLSQACTKKLDNLDFFKKYNPKSINFFQEVGFDDFKEINKWEENIKYDFVGQPHDGDIQLLDTIFAEAMQIIKPIKIEKIKKGEKPNLIIYFGDKMGNIKPQSEGLSQLCRNNRIIKFGASEIWADPKYGGKRRQAIFRHELLHVLGLSHPPKGKLYKVIISPFFFIDERGWDDPDFVLTYKYTELDIAALSILYDKSIPNGMDLESFKKAYQQYLLIKTDHFYNKIKGSF